MDAVEKILSLLSYIEEVEKLKQKPSFVVPEEHFTAYRHAIKGLPGVNFGVQSAGDDIWLLVQRLEENLPPALRQDLEPWVILTKNPETPPELRKSLEVPEVGKQPARTLKIEDHPQVIAAFDSYQNEVWKPWADLEIPRRKTILLYNKLFALRQIMELDGVESQLELVWGVGYSTWKPKNSSLAIKHPLITQLCELSLDEKTFEIRVRPRDTDPRIETDAYAALENSGVHGLEAAWRDLLGTMATRVNPFEDATFEPALRAAVGYLDAQGTYRVLNGDTAPAQPGPTLQVTNDWVVFARKRSADIFMADIRRLKEKLESASELPGVVRTLVEEGDDTVRARLEQPYRGLSSSEVKEGASELYFPMPYNDEQVSIIQKLHHNDGVVVQGPPGTGKTHTIANVICHYLAQGKRVLVTANSDSALSVLQDKLPAPVRPLSVSLLSQESEGKKQFEHSIQTIAAAVADMNPDTAALAIRNHENTLNELHAKIVTVDRNISEFANRHMQKYPFRGQEVSPEELARVAMQEADTHQWFDDTPSAFPDAWVSEADISALRQARIKVGQDIIYLGLSLPVVDDFPVWGELWSLHQDLVKARSIDAAVTEGTLLPLANAQIDTFQKAEALDRFMAERQKIQENLGSLTAPWVPALIAKLRKIPNTSGPLVALSALSTQLQDLEAARQTLLPSAIDVPEGAEQHQHFVEAMARLIAGKSAFGLPFGKGEARKLLAEVNVQGSPVKDKDGWGLVQQQLDWRRDVRKVLASWNSLAGEIGVETAPAGNIDTSFRQVLEWKQIVESAKALVYHFDAKLPDHLELVFGKSAFTRLQSLSVSAADKLLRDSLRGHLDKGRLSFALRRLQEVIEKLKGRTGSICNELLNFLKNTLGVSETHEVETQATWDALMARLSQLTSLRPHLEEIARVRDLLKEAGAPKWASRVASTPATRDYDPETPTIWSDAWGWRKTVMFLDEIEGHDRLQGLFEQRRALTTTLSSTYQELVASKTWLGVFNNSPDNVRQALQRYLNSVQAMGSGTGVRAVRHRRTAQEAMLSAYRAVPCWILPQYRVSETIPPEVGLFDLVIIDEASQSDIWALPALLRGKKLLVVGDHKQVSPSAIGTAEEKIKDLCARFLSKQPHGSEMTPDKSIYDLARVVFAGNSVMLKEHFRCVPAIIEFSNREYYEGDIRPLRVPKITERLDPPLVDVFVHGGFKNEKDVNEGEARAIVDEMLRIIGDETFDGRTIGVVTLQGTAQAKRIQEMVSATVPAREIVARKISVGPPPVFQGKERDIMMVSMVIGRGNPVAANRNDIHQRFNVALSRARDRMYLFRSIHETEIREDSLNARVIRHFRQPFKQDAQKVAALRERCESGFEFEMFDALVQRGYRVEPQVACGGYRIDFVVHGNEGRRLAVECDGDKYHGPEQWASDMARQRVLERAGWIFWRCFASSFVRNKSLVLQDLVSTLTNLGIEPLGAESVDSSVWAISIEVNPFEAAHEAVSED